MWGSLAGCSVAVIVLGALVDLNHPATYVHWHFFQMSVANVVVIVLMIVVFAAAIAIPFRGRRTSPEDRESGEGEQP